MCLRLMVRQTQASIACVTYVTMYDFTGESSYKKYIIDEVHMLSTAAFNALLKTLEEPPPHVKFIFATTEPQKIPITILSRCQRFDFRKVGSKELTKHFESVLEREGVELSDRALAAVVRQARGSVRDGMSLLDQVLSFAGDSAQDDEIFEALGVVDRSVMGSWFPHFRPRMRPTPSRLFETWTTAVTIRTKLLKLLLVIAATWQWFSEPKGKLRHCSIMRLLSVQIF